MIKGRINERNTGKWSNGSQLKQRRSNKVEQKELTPLQEKKEEVKSLINDILSSDSNNYYSYIRWDMSNETLRQWASNGIIEKGIKKGKNSLFPDKEICILKDKNSLIIANGLIETYILL